MSKIKWSSILIALVYMALGILFIVRPLNVEDALCYVLAIAVAVLGLLYLAGYFITSASSEESGNGFAIGVLMVMLAVFIVAKQELIITLVPFLFGVMVMIRGLFTIQAAFRIKRLGLPMSFPLIMGLVIMAFGLFIMLFPLESGEILFIIIGCGLLAAGVSGIIEEISVTMMHRRQEHERERLKDMGPSIKAYDAEPIAEVAEAVAAPAEAVLKSEKADEADEADKADEAAEAAEADESAKAAEADESVKPDESAKADEVVS